MDPNRSPLLSRGVFTCRDPQNFIGFDPRAIADGRQALRRFHAMTLDEVRPNHTGNVLKQCIIRIHRDGDDLGLAARRICQPGCCRK